MWRLSTSACRSFDQARTDSSRDALIIRVSTDAGVTGYGEVDSSPLVVKAIVEAPASHTIARGLRELLIGRDPLEVERLWHDMYEATLYVGRSGVVIHAMAGVDIALWDLKGKLLGLPVHNLLGGAHRTEIRAYASNMFQFTPEATADRAAAAVEAGYHGREVRLGAVRRRRAERRGVRSCDSPAGRRRHRDRD